MGSSKSWKKEKKQKKHGMWQKTRSSTDLLEPLGTLNGNKCFGGQRIRESYEPVRFLGSTKKDGSFEGKHRVWTSQNVAWDWTQVSYWAEMFNSGLGIILICPISSLYIYIYVTTCSWSRSLSRESESWKLDDSPHGEMDGPLGVLPVIFIALDFFAVATHDFNHQLFTLSWLLQFEVRAMVVSMGGFRRVKFRFRKPQRNPQPKAGDEVETVNAHAGVLRAASPVLNAMLSGQGVRQTRPWYWARSLTEVS